MLWFKRKCDTCQFLKSCFYLRFGGRGSNESAILALSFKSFFYWISTLFTEYCIYFPFAFFVVLVSFLKQIGFLIFIVFYLFMVIDIYFCSIFANITSCAEVVVQTKVRYLLKSAVLLIRVMRMGGSNKSAIL